MNDVPSEMRTEHFSNTHWATQDGPCLVVLSLHAHLTVVTAKGLQL